MSPSAVRLDMRGAHLSALGDRSGADSRRSRCAPARPRIGASRTSAHDGRELTLSTRCRLSTSRAARRKPDTRLFPQASEGSFDLILSQRTSRHASKHQRSDRRERRTQTTVLIVKLKVRFAIQRQSRLRGCPGHETLEPHARPPGGRAHEEVQHLSPRATRRRRFVSTPPALRVDEPSRVGSYHDTGLTIWRERKSYVRGSKPRLIAALKSFIDICV